MKPDRSISSRRSFIRAGATIAVATGLLKGSRGQDGSPPVRVPELARNGGPKAISNDTKVWPRWGEPERRQVVEAMAQPSLFHWQGAGPNTQTALVIERFKRYFSLEHAMTCSSGTSALHVAVAASGIAAGDEVITTPINDFGGASCILFQQAVPVFADVEPSTWNLDVRSVERCITPRTKAIIAPHIEGVPCDLTGLKGLADKHGLILIEDCAIAWGTKYRGKLVGTWGHVACFSMGNGKPVDAGGEGGMVASSDPRIGPALHTFIDKGYQREAPNFDRLGHVLATNYRMSELQAAFAAPQLAQIEEMATKRESLGQILAQEVSGLPCVMLPHIRPEDRVARNCFNFRLRLDKIRCSREEFAEAIEAEGVPCATGWIPAPLYQMPHFQAHSFFGGRWPLKEFGVTKMDYTQVRCPEAEAILKSDMRFWIYPSMDAAYMREVGAALRKVAYHYQIA